VEKYYNTKSGLCQQKFGRREHFVKSEEGKAKGEKSSIPSLSSLIPFLPLCVLCG